MNVGAIGTQAPARQANSAAKSESQKYIQALEKQKQELQDQIKEIKDNKGISDDKKQKQITELQKQIELLDQQIAQARQQQSEAERSGKGEQAQAVSKAEEVQEAPERPGAEQLPDELRHPHKYDEYISSGDQPKRSASGVYQVARDDEGKTALVSDLTAKEREDKGPFGIGAIEKQDENGEDDEDRLFV